MTAPLAGKLAAVTGGTRGIGRAIAETFRRDGAQVIVTGRNPEGEAPEGCEFVAADFSGTEAVDEFADFLARRSPDILVNNAGINKIARFAEIEPADFNRIQQVNVTAAFRLCQSVVPEMQSRGWGRIVNICSVWGIVGKEQRASYSASKFALAGMTAALAAEVAAAGVLVNCVSPGIIETEMTRTAIDEQQLAELLAQVPAGRLGRPDEVAALVAWLAGPQNTFIAGQNIAIDGGLTRG